MQHAVDTLRSCVLNRLLFHHNYCYLQGELQDCALDTRILATQRATGTMANTAHTAAHTVTAHTTPPPHTSTTTSTSADSDAWGTAL